MEKELALAKAVAALTQRESEAYHRYIEDGKPSLAASTAANFFQLYLLGHSCEEIATLNPAFGLGIIVRARVDFGWDERRLEHVQVLLDNIRQIAQAAQLGAVQFVVEGLAVFQKLAGSKFQKYLQTGREEDLGDFKGMNLKTYKELLEMLLKLTGQEPAKKVQGVVEHRHSMETPREATRVDRPMTAADANEFLTRLKKGTT